MWGGAGWSGCDPDGPLAAPSSLPELLLLVVVVAAVVVVVIAGREVGVSVVVVVVVVFGDGGDVETAPATLLSK